MFTFLSNMSIFRRLFLAAMLSALIPGIIIFVLGTSYVSTLTTINNTVQESNNAIRLVTGLQANLQRMNALISGINSNNTIDSVTATQILTETNSLAHDFDQNYTSYEKNYQIVDSNSMTDVRNVLNSSGLGKQTPISQRSTIFIVNMQWQEYKTSQNRVLSDVTAILKTKNAAPTNQLIADLTQMNSQYQSLKGNLDTLVNLTENLSQQVLQVNTSQVTSIIIGTVIAFLLSTLAVLAIGYLVNKTITNPLRRLAQLTGRIAQGETYERAHVEGNDEINLVATSMNTMLDNIVRLMNDTQGQRDVLQARVDRLIKEVSSIAEGDLRVQLAITPDTFGVLANSFNYMIQELGNLVIHVKVVANEVDNLMGTTLDRMNHLVESANSQSKQTTNSAREVENVAQFSRKVTERTNILSQLALGSRQTAFTGRESLKRAVEEMGRIQTNVHSTAGMVRLLGESSREINNLVELITNVAHQTNRLALDASVQAAMAGANGKGFGAVASDIRRFAEQTKLQAAQITHIVRALNLNINNTTISMQETERETAEGAVLAQQAETALVTIFEAIELQANEIENINTLTTQQLQASSLVLQDMRGVSLAAQESNASTRMAAQNMWKLAQLLQQLRKSVEAFKLPEQQAAPTELRWGQAAGGSNPHLNTATTGHRTRLIAE